ncbi:MAG TPA: hypothetical protein VLA34_10170 [Candidatus Krumholzibacterium sp.]|nr:hypothetical protein [Candidatus Krumholzibacterium sp.]
MGRRPSVHKKLAQSLGGQTPEVQAQIDKIAMLLLDELHNRLKDKRDGGAFKTLTLKEMMSELRGILKALQRPATSLQQINIPVNPQMTSETTRRDQQIKHAAVDPEERRKMRESAERYLDRKDQDG